MNNSKITINGQEYDSIETMPADVRSLYEEAMRTAGSSPASGGTTRVFASGSGRSSVVVNRTITVNGQSYNSVDELPPDLRQLYQDALKVAASQAGAAHPKVSMHMSVDFTRSGAGTHEDARELSPLPIESSSTESRLRGLPTSLAILIAIALILWVFLGR